MPVGQPTDRSALILYGSETGNAFDVAEELGRITERLHFLTDVSKLDAVEASSLSKYSVVIIAISTTGQGDLPINARQFWKGLLRRKLPPNYLEDVQFTVFGLGDSSYPKFNWAARKLNKRMIQLGANELYPHGEADEQHPEGLDASFVPWSTDLRRQLLIKFPLDEGISPVPEDTLLEPKWSLSLIEEENLNGYDRSSLNGHHSRPSPLGDFPTKDDESNGKPHPSGEGRKKGTGGDTEPFSVTLIENKRMTVNSHWQDVRHLSLIASSPASYEPGDVLTVYPKNFAEDVDNFLTMMDWRDVADKPLRFVSIRRASNFDTNRVPTMSSHQATQDSTLRNLLTDHLDITAIPRRSFFSMIAHFTQDEMHKGRLLEFTKPEYIDELYDYTTRPRRSIPEVLQEFDSVRIPWQWAANVLPELRGRQFSIASGGHWKSTDSGTARFDLLVAIVKYKTVIKKVREGVCTRYLASLPLGTQMNVTLQRGGLGITGIDASRPVVMVGPGTGVAPMRSLIWERLYCVEELETQAQSKGGGKSNGVHGVGESILFFGCRRQDSDYFYQEAWEELKGKMPLQVFAAFSRDQSRKIYVQDLIREQADLVFRLLHDSDGIVYVCGSSGKMPQAVRLALTDVFKQVGDMGQGVAEAYLQLMEKQGRYKQETW